MKNYIHWMEGRRREEGGKGETSVIFQAERKETASVGWAGFFVRLPLFPPDVKDSLSLSFSELDRQRDWQINGEEDHNHWQHLTLGQ